MLANETATLQEVAAAIGREPDWLRRNWLKLHEREAFPRKLPCGWVWPRALVEAWLRSGGLPPAPIATANDNQLSDPRAAYRAALSQRYGVEA